MPAKLKTVVLKFYYWIIILKIIDTKKPQQTNVAVFLKMFLNKQLTYFLVALMVEFTETFNKNS